MADVSLAVVGLAFEVFTAVLKTCEFISTAQGLASDAPVLYWKFRVEITRLRAYGEFWGLNTGNTGTLAASEGLAETILGILQQIQGLVNSVGEVSEKYGFESLSLASQAIVDGKKDGKEKGAGPKLTSKFKWAFKDKAKAEGLAQDIRELNDGLYALLRIAEFRVVDLVTQSELLRTSAAQKATSLLQDAIAVDIKASEPRQLRAAREELQLGVNAQRLMETQTSQFEAPSGVVTKPSGPRQLLTTAEKVFQDRPSALRTLARFRQDSNPSEDMTVLIEWRDIEKTSAYAALVTDRIDALANLLHNKASKPATFRALECLQYFEDIHYSRFGLLFSLPPNAAAEPPVTLYDLLARGENSILPDLGDRFALAQAVSQSILRFHDCGWVHAAFRSSNVMIFRSANTSALIFSSPYIGGFSYSRPTDPAESTLEYSRPSDEHDVYRHPAIQRSNPFLPMERKYTRFEQRHDLFALGVVLLEIGLWDRAIALKKPKYTPEKFLTKLVEAYVPLLGHRMGAVYRDVVRALLDDSLAANPRDNMQESNASALGTTKDANLTEDRNEEDEEPVDHLYGDNSYWATLIARLAMCRA